MSEELLRMEIEYSKQILKEIYERFVAMDWDNSLTLPEILNQRIIPHINTVIRPNDTTTAKRIYDIWKKIFKKTRPGYRDQYLRMIAHRLREGYSEVDLIQAIIGLSKSEHHLEQGYTDIYYCIRSPQQVELMMSRAEIAGITKARIETRLEQYITNPTEFGSSTDSGYTNPRTGKSIK